MRPFANPPEFYYFPTLQFEPFGGMPFLTRAPPPAIFFPVVETPLANTIVIQIDYYFSDANLVRDEYLRSNMDEQGWVPISLIVRSLRSNIKLIRETVEVQCSGLEFDDIFMTFSRLRMQTLLVKTGSKDNGRRVVDGEREGRRTAREQGGRLQNCSVVDDCRTAHDGHRTGRDVHKTGRDGHERDCDGDITNCDSHKMTRDRHITTCEGNSTRFDF
ncbi:la-related protein 1A-like isoform X2 [Vigna unguiculata]|uniref:la-related protein 1A-like isoform X2 n=1 Tax=Vigna unguiculata TaxID=3917 RepID=UPI001016A7A5|nr:la-related protein 1A-like isoform X2 [Vigna unguiculata]